MELQLTQPRRADKTTILFIHGAWHGAWCWELWEPFFRQAGYGTALLNLRGHSIAAQDYKHVRLSEYIQDAKAALARLDGPVILIGHSMGGLIAQHLMTQQTFKAAVMVATVPLGGLPPLPYVLESFRHPLVALRTLATQDMYPWVSSSRLVRRAFFSHLTTDTTIQRYAGLAQGESLRLFMLDLFFASTPVPLPGTPTLVLSGEFENIFTPARARQTADFLRADFYVVPKSGHDIMLDQSWKIAARYTEEWLKNLPAN